MTEQVEQKVDPKEDWINKKWRPAMGWMYMAVCTFDFIIAPILWAVVQFWEVSAANDAFRQWQPLTLQGAGLFHMAMGAVLGISAYGRTKEKLEGVASAGGPILPSLGSTTPATVPTAASFSAAPVAVPAASFAATPPATFTPAPAAPSFTAAPAAAQPVTFTASGKKVVPQEPDPEI